MTLRRAAALPQPKELSGVERLGASLGRWLGVALDKPSSGPPTKP